MNRVRVAKLVYHYTIGGSKTLQEVYRRLVMTSPSCSAGIPLNPLRLPSDSREMWPLLSLIASVALQLA